jgi:hypothetical protein
MTTEAFQTKILVSALAAGVLSVESVQLLTTLSKEPSALEIAKSFGSPRLIRGLKLIRENKAGNISLKLEYKENQVLYQGQAVGRIKILYKSPIPGELQAKLAIESAIDRFLEYLQKVHQIVVLDESDRHVRVFVPSLKPVEFSQLWQEFLGEVAFSDYGKHQLPGLVQTFTVMLNSVTLAGRGFSTLDVPILTQAQANVLAAWYRAVIRDVKKRQSDRQKQINQLKQELTNLDLPEKERKSKQKELQDKEAMQAKEAQKYTEYFQKSFIQTLQEQNIAWQELEAIQQQLANANITKAQEKKLQKQQEKLLEKVTFSRGSIQQKLQLVQQTGNAPFVFVDQDEKQYPEKFKQIAAIVPTFTKTATDQINSTRGDIFTQCICEMYRLLEMEHHSYDALPLPLLTEEPIFPAMRSPGDDSKEFCYSCGVALDPKKARWQVLRFMFERPSQRRQSSTGEGRPHICASCAAMAFASPLKVTDESIILKLEAKDNSLASNLKLKDYLRMLTNKEMHLSAGRYVVLASDRTSSGDLASQKLGQVQYALAKVASIFPVEVLSDFKFSLVIQGNSVYLASRHLIFIKGLMNCYKQSIMIAGKEINMTLGDAVRHMQYDLPSLAEYTLAKNSGFETDLNLEQIREHYWKALKQDLHLQGDSMDSNNQLPKRARLYRDVAALTGLTYAFAQFLESTAKGLMKQEDAEREVSKLIEKVDDAIAFCYYATLGDEKKTSVQARLYHNPDCDFIYRQIKALLTNLSIPDRESKDDKGKLYLQFYADDVSHAYQHFATKDYAQEKDWKELTYNLKLSLYTRFPELVRKLKSTSEKN